MMNFCTLTTCWRGPKCLNSIFDKKTDVVQYGSKSTNTDMAEDRQAHTPSVLSRFVRLVISELIWNPVDKSSYTGEQSERPPRPRGKRDGFIETERTPLQVHFSLSFFFSLVMLNLILALPASLFAPWTFNLLYTHFTWLLSLVSSTLVILITNGLLTILNPRKINFRNLNWTVSERNTNTLAAAA